MSIISPGKKLTQLPTTILKSLPAPLITKKNVYEEFIAYQNLFKSILWTIKKECDKVVRITRYIHRAIY